MMMRDKDAVERRRGDDGSAIVTGSSSTWREAHVRNRLSYALEGADEDTQRLKDITFLVGENQEPIKAHKLILSLSSQYFFALINPMRDEANPVIYIPTVNPQLFQRLLRFIYTDEIETTDLPQFLDMAKRFGYKSLPLIILGTLRNSELTLENVSVAMEMANYVGDDAFGARCRNFIKKHSNLVLNPSSRSPARHHSDPVVRAPNDNRSSPPIPQGNFINSHRKCYPSPRQEETAEVHGPPPKPEPPLVPSAAFAPPNSVLGRRRKKRGGVKVRVRRQQYQLLREMAQRPKVPCPQHKNIPRKGMEAAFAQPHNPRLCPQPQPLMSIRFLPAQPDLWSPQPASSPSTVPYNPVTTSFDTVP